VPALRKAGTKLYRHVDTENIGTFGYSFGGAATLNLSLHSDLIKACVDLDGFFYSSNWQQPITQPVMLLQNDSSPALTFPFLNATHDAYLATVKDTRHGNFCDFGEIMAENQIATAIVSGKDVELPILGAIDPDTMEGIMNTLLLDFFDKYLKDKNSQALDTDNEPKGVTVLKKIQDSEDNQ
jgi:pimeloyl-ACP methyl ester carboxylesterase